ncbi:MAG TPA: flagellar motor switch protein FliG [Solirubrobacteraceae bacterium]|nr:flagellar motor switch protein FliG [Solirubrobacteraceae bacterium]
MSGNELALQPREPGALPAIPPPVAGGMRGRQKAAVLLIALGAQNAAEVLKHLSEREVEALSLEMAALESVEPAVGEVVLDELAERVIASEAMGKGGVDYARSVLEHLFGPERAGEVIQLVSEAAEGRPFDFVRRTPAEQIAAFLVDESPQTIALVVANLSAGHGAKVLAELPTDMQPDVALRIALMGETSPSVVRDVAQGLRDKLSNVLEHEYSSAGGVETLAELLNQAGRSTERNVLQTIGASHEDLAEEVRARLFTFEDLHRLADRELQLVLREVDHKDLSLALRGVPDWLMEKITSNMSTRATELLREDIEAQAPQRKHVVEEAQGRIVAIVRRLEDNGTITLGGSSAEEEEELV